MIGSVPTGKGGKVGMKDPYESTWKDIGNALTTYSNMILWIAERTLSVKDYKEFVDAFTNKKHEDDELIDFLCREGNRK